MKVRFRHEAKTEYLEAIAWYENRRSGLGREFAEQIGHAVTQAQLAPGRFREVGKGVRKVRVARFPYSVYFKIIGAVFGVLAVFHDSRDPRSLDLRLR